jgi:hypothetical protein
MMMYLNRDMDGRPFLVYFLPILGGQKTAVSDLAEGWCAAPGFFPSHYPLISARTTRRMDIGMTGMDDGTSGFRGGFISHPDVF